MLDPIDVAIVGTGTAGSAAALFLAQLGHRITLFERVLDPQPIGAGILLQPTGQFVLARLSLLDQVVAKGARIDRLRAVTNRGRTLLDLHYEDLDASYFGVGLHRGVLFDTLFSAARADERIHFELGADVVAIEAHGRRGRTLQLADGRRHGPFALVVLTDGAGSALSRSLAIGGSRALYPWGALWTVVADEQRTFSGELYQVVNSAAEMVGFLPTGLGPQGDQPLVSVFDSVRADRVEEVLADFPRWRARVSAADPRIGALLQRVRREQILFARYRDVQLDAWHDAGVVLLGDAAHAMSPQLGQGANLALVDAMVLADILAQASRIDDALARYTQQRRHHLAYYQFATRWLTPFFQSDSTLLARARDLFMPIATRIGWIRANMIRSMAGTHRGPLRRPLSLTAASRARPSSRS
jgi:2-polyprenyl-6-methoxyphenol hydroxylase-like FAD-dependent oxidoreductase